MKRLATLGASVIAMQLFGAQQAMAQDAPVQPAEAAGASEGLNEITVTAQRRSEGVQKAALSITAVSGDDILKRSVTQVEQLGSLAPGLQVNTSAGPYASFSVRSVSSLSGNAFADPAVAVNIDGVYLATPTVLHGLYYDLDRVEILKGPQGTLYGRNATAGAINIIPRRPEFRNGGNIYTEIGNLGRFNLGGAVNLAASDTLALRVAGQTVHRSGYFSDGSADDSGQAVRASLLFEPTTDLSILIAGDYSHQGGTGQGATIRKECQYVPGAGTTGACYVADPYTGIADLASQFTSVGEAPPTQDQYIRGNYYGSMLDADYRTPIGTITFIGAYREAHSRYKSTSTSWQLREDQRPKQTSGELRLASNAGSPLQYVLGLYYLDTSIDARAQGETQNRNSFSDSDTHNNGSTWAAFSQLTYSLTDTLRLSGGLRYTSEKKSTDSARYNYANTRGPDPVFPDQPVGTPNIVLKENRSWDHLDWKVGVEFDAAPRSLIYANVSTGFKAGGFYYGPVGANTYEPEYVTSYAVGAKNRFADNRIQLNFEAFYLDYTDQQISFVKLVGPSAVLVTENAGKTHAYGVEADAQFLIGQDTQIGLSGSWVRARYDEFSFNTIAPPSATSLCAVSPASGSFNVDCAGLQPIRTPKFSVTGTFDQGFDVKGGGRIFLDARATYKSRFYTSTDYQIESLTNEFFRADFGIGYEGPGKKYRVRAFVDNAFDQVTISNTTTNTSYGQNHVVGVNLLPPRTFGVQLSTKF